MIVFKALSIRQNSCLVLFTRPKPVTGYITGPIGEPNAIILLNGHCIALPGQVLTFLLISQCINPDQRSFFFFSREILIQRPTSAQM